MKPSLKPMQIDCVPTAADSENIHLGLPQEKDSSVGRRFNGPVWRRLYVELLNERDPNRLQELVAAAERAILTRFQELAGDRSASEERQDLHNAADVLGAFQKEKLTSPNGENKNSNGSQQFSSWLDNVRP